MDRYCFSAWPYLMAVKVDMVTKKAKEKRRGHQQNQKQ